MGTLKRIVRDSKFRHLFSNFNQKDGLYDGFQPKDNRLDGDTVAINKYFIALALDNFNGSTFTILDRSKPGRVEQIYRVIGHSSEIVDLVFNPFNPLQIASGAEDGTFLIWNLPMGGLTGNLEEYQSRLNNSQRRAVKGNWHPCASDIFIGANQDCITIFNTLTQEAIRTIQTSQWDQIFNLSVNFNGTECVVSFKDKQIRTFDLYTGNKLLEFSSHEGSKTIRVTYIVGEDDKTYIASTGATKMSERQLCVWDPSNVSSPLLTESFDNATSALYIYYDYDTRLICFYGKGESSIRFYEFDTKPIPKVQLVSTISCGESHRAIGIGDKFSGNISACVVIQIARVISKGVEEIPCTVPRKSDAFQADLFPDTRGEVPAMSAEDFEAGKVTNPIMVSLKDYAQPDFSNYTASRSATLTKRGESRTSSSKVSSKPVVGSSNMDLKDHIFDLTNRVQKLEERLNALEKK